MRSLGDAPLRGKDVLLVADYNVQVEDGRPVCSYKIDQTLPTIRYILDAGCRSLTIASHMGRPSSRDEFSMRPVYEYLRGVFSSLKYRECSQKVGNGTGGIFMTDNLRYYGDEELSEFYGSFGTIVSDAFGSAHRKTPFRGFAGLLMAREIEKLGAIRNCDLVIMGGAKISDKLRIMETFGGTIFAGGCLGLTLLKTLGVEVGGRSKCEVYGGEALRSRLVAGTEPGDARVTGHERPGAIILPADFRVVENGGACKVKRYDEISEDDECIDIGPSSIECLRELVGRSRSIFWNGPVGKIEDDRCGGTSTLVDILQDCGADVVAGGGETLGMVLRHSSVEKFAHVSTGGGAMLQFLGGGAMPGIENLL